MPDIVDRKGKPTLITDAVMLAVHLRALPPGVTSDLSDVRKAFAAEYGADMTCPVTVQRLLVEFSQSGDVPYWRVVDPDRPFAKRLAGGGDRVREMLAGDV